MSDIRYFNIFELCISDQVLKPSPPPPTTMLWKKESNRQNALYVDLSNELPDMSLQLIDIQMTGYLHFQRSNEKEIFHKNDKLSLAMRKKGNEFFDQNELPKALAMYNKSVCFAKQRSEHISLAYVNRAICFLKMKMYQECLNDIELAKAAAYPQHLMEKLKNREAECMKHMKGEEDAISITKCDLKLNFEPNEQFPYFANILKIDKDTNGDDNVTAKENIDVGQTIAIEKAFSAYLYSRYYWRCNICLKEMGNLVPCKKCNVAMFCLDCKDNWLHDYECGKRISDNNKENGDIMEDVRTIFMAINAFPKVDELMRFVEKTIKNEPMESTSGTLTDFQSKYYEYLKLQIPPNDKRQYFQIIFHVILTYKYILHIPKIATMFKTEKYRRFLKHLIFHHALSTTFNSRRSRIANDFGEQYYTQTGIMHKYLKHSCAPNVFMGEIDGHFVCISIRPVEKGEQLLTSFYRFLLKPTHLRQATYLDRTQTVCTCTRCVVPPVSSNQSLQLSLDPDFKYIKSTFATLDYCDFSVYPYHYDREKSCAIIQKCVQFLKNHGQSAWCDEIGLVVGVYMYLLRLWINPGDIMSLL